MGSFNLKFDKDKILKKITQKAFEMTGERIAKIAGQTRCPTHGETAKAVKQNNDTWKITGCCKELIQAVKDKMRKK